MNKIFTSKYKPVLYFKKTLISCTTSGEQEWLSRNILIISNLDAAA
jgi:hypothetical protein